MSQAGIAANHHLLQRPQDSKSPPPKHPRTTETPPRQKETEEARENHGKAGVAKENLGKGIEAREEAPGGQSTGTRNQLIAGSGTGARCCCSGSDAKTRHTSSTA